MSYIYPDSASWQRHFAFVPIKSDSGRLIWLNYYYVLHQRIPVYQGVTLYKKFERVYTKDEAVLYMIKIKQK